MVFDQARRYFKECLGSFWFLEEQAARRRQIDPASASVGGLKTLTSVSFMLYIICPCLKRQ